MENVSTEQIVKRVLERAAQLKMSPRKVSLLAGGGPDLIRDWKGPKAPLPRLDSIQKIADVLQTTAGWLAFGEGGAMADRKTRSVPVISWVAASQFADTGHIDDADEAPTIEVDGIQSRSAFALRVKGDSVNLIAPDDSLVIVEPEDRDLAPRRFYIFRNQDGATLKRYMTNPPRLEPYSSNPAHEALAIDGTTSVIGRVSRVIIDI